MAACRKTSPKTVSSSDRPRLNEDKTAPPNKRSLVSLACNACRNRKSRVSTTEQSRTRHVPRQANEDSVPSSAMATGQTARPVSNCATTVYMPRRQRRRMSSSAVSKRYFVPPHSQWLTGSGRSQAGPWANQAGPTPKIWPAFRRPALQAETRCQIC